MRAAGLWRKGTSVGNEAGSWRAATGLGRFGHTDIRGMGEASGRPGRHKGPAGSGRNGSTATNTPHFSGTAVVCEAAGVWRPRQERNLHGHSRMRQGREVSVGTGTTNGARN